MKSITSGDNPRLKQLAKLIQNRRARQTAQQAVLEGVHVSEAFLNAAYTIETLYVPQHKLANTEVAALLHRLPETPVYVVADAALGKITSLTQADDIMAVVALPPPQRLPERGDCVVLERVQDPGNVGTILRSAAAAGVRQVLLSADCADVWSPKVLRAGMGAHALLHIFSDADLPMWRRAYRHPVYATALSCDSVTVYDLDLGTPAAWLLGNEGSGLSADLQHSADARVLIPMAANTESLNVAMAATVCLFEQMRQRLNSHQP